MEWFCFGIDPVIDLLDRILTGILIVSLPVFGPSLPPPAPIIQKYTVQGYCYDLKPAITSIHEFILVEQSIALFEKSSGCKLHRDPASNKCKFLPLGRWRGVLTQENIPVNFFTLSDHLEMLGQELGLGLFNIELRAKSYQINTFLETACKPKFRHSLYHKILYRQEVRLQESGLVKVEVPPYFSGDFFPQLDG